jgi:hypothetical protein
VGYLSVDIEEGGLFAGPRITWNAMQDLDLEVGVMVSNDEGEFSVASNMLFLTASWYF